MNLSKPHLTSITFFFFLPGRPDPKELMLCPVYFGLVPIHKRLRDALLVNLSKFDSQVDYLKNVNTTHILTFLPLCLLDFSH
jgi:hypothetical protein